MNDLLKQLKEKIRCKISGLNYNAWIRPILDARVKDNVFILSVPNKFIADWVNDYYSDLVRKELFRLTQSNFKIAFDIAPPPEEPVAEAEEEAPEEAPEKPVAEVAEEAPEEGEEKGAG